MLFLCLLHIKAENILVWEPRNSCCELLSDQEQPHLPWHGRNAPSCCQVMSSELPLILISLTEVCAYASALEDKRNRPSMSGKWVSVFLFVLFS